MLGAVIGDIAGSRFEHHNCKRKDFELLHPGCRPTDDSVMTIAVAEAILEADGDWDRLETAAVACLQRQGRRYPRAGYGGSFRSWLNSDAPQPYNSWGNGAAMRVSPAGWAGQSLEEARLIARRVTAVTHNHPEGLKAAECTAALIFLARTGTPAAALRAEAERWYPLTQTLDEIRPDYRFDVSCMGTMPPALEALFEAEDYEDAIRGAVSVGGDSDTIAAICGGMAEALFGIPEELRLQGLGFLDAEQTDIVSRFEAKYGAK